MKKAFAALAILLLPFGTLETLSYFEEVPTFEAVRASYRSSDGVLLDRQGEALQVRRVGSRGRRLEWTSLSDISPALIETIKISEDRRFSAHHGVDWRAMAGALLRYPFTRQRRGASTISMQLVSLLRPDLRAKTFHRSWRQKFHQMAAARTLERSWSKDDIFESYLNLVTFRGELQGVSAASQGLFHKTPSGINEEEASLMAALLRDPEAPAHIVAMRAQRKMNGVAMDELARRTLRGPFMIAPAASDAPHLARRLWQAMPVSDRAPILKIRCTVDGPLQRFSHDALEAQVLALVNQNVTDGALLVVDNRTGEVLSYIGSVARTSRAALVDGVQAQRQVGSTLKPFIYARAFDRKLLTADSLLDDSPLNFPDATGLFNPHDYDNAYRGLLPVRVALASSINIPAVRALLLVGKESFLQTLQDLGFEHLQPAEFYGPSLALGTADLSLWDLVNAYRTLANGGLWTPLRVRPEDPASPSRRVFSPEAAFVVSDILSDRESRSTTFGMESALATRFWTAVKTGTSKDMRDNWCVGYSDRYTVGVWVGNFSGESMWNVSGMSGAAPVWVEVMEWLHKNQASQPPKPPRGVLAMRVEGSRFIGPHNEWFLRGTEPVTAGRRLDTVQTHVVYPPSGTLIALDPDIPREQQAVFFDAEPHDAHLYWTLNGQVMGDAKEALPWHPLPGSYTLALKDVNHHTMDQVTFEVRGTIDNTPRN